MKLVSLTFLLALVGVHFTGQSAKLIALPLSQFRDGPQAWVGYVLFAILLFLGGMYTHAAVRRGRVDAATVGGLAAFLLFIVAITPSLGSFHFLCSLLVFFLLFSYYAILLYRAESAWMLAHLAVPVALALATRFHSYGIWQKGFVMYLVITVTAHHHFMTRTAAITEPKSASSRPKSGSRKRRRVYQLEPGRAWKRKSGR